MLRDDMPYFDEAPFLQKFPAGLGMIFLCLEASRFGNVMQMPVSIQDSGRFPCGSVYLPDKLPHGTPARSDLQYDPSCPSPG